MTKENQCALTREIGKFVKCHILPQSLTKPAVRGRPLYQSTRGKGERRRWSSWYDCNLVTREGESILASIDDKAIKQLRKHRLVWSSWIVFRPQIESLAPLLPNHGFRKIVDLDSDALIRFALSIAWRASASSLPDMSDATLDSGIQERLREYVIGRKIVGPSDFPVSLTQLSTLGEPHNQTPYTDEKDLPDLENVEHNPLKILRIYMDGLVFHVHFSPIPEKHLDNNPLYLGASDYSLIPTVTYEASFQYENMLFVMRECFK